MFGDAYIKFVNETEEDILKYIQDFYSKKYPSAEIIRFNERGCLEIKIKEIKSADEHIRLDRKDISKGIESNALKLKLFKRNAELAQYLLGLLVEKYKE